LHKNGIPCVGLDINLDNVKAIQNAGIEGVFGDSTSPDILESIGLRNAFLVIITVSGRHIIPKILATVKLLAPQVKVLVRIHFLQELEDLKHEAGDHFIVSEEETAKTIIKKALDCYGLECES
jgi:voltage-gated potassium channel Kch